jgi:hypothetical protein
MDRPRRRAVKGSNRIASTYYRGGGRPPADSPFKVAEETKASGGHWLRTADIILILILLFGLGWSLILQPHARVVASDTSYHSVINYQDSANHYLQGLRDKTKITFDQNKLAAGLKRDYPEIDAVSVELPIFSAKPTIRLAIAVPSFFLQAAAHQYLIDANGRVVALKSQYPAIKNLPLVIDQSGYMVEPGQLVLGRPSVDFIKTVVAQVEANHLKIKSLTLPATPEELDLRTQDQPYFVKFYLGGDANLQAGQFLAARANFAKKHTQPSSYLDVRVSGKVFYE